MRRIIYHIICLMVALILCSCDFDESDNSFRGGELLDNERLSEIKAEFITEETSGIDESNAETEKHTEKQTEKQTEKRTEKITEWQTEKQTAVQTEKQTDVKTEKPTEIKTESDTALESDLSTESESKEQYESESEIVTESTSETTSDTAAETTEETTKVDTCDETEIESEIQSELVSEVVTEHSSVDEEGIVYWVKRGKVWHVDEDCRYIKDSKEVESGSVEDALEEGKEKVCSSCGK